MFRLANVSTLLWRHSQVQARRISIPIYCTIYVPTARNSAIFCRLLEIKFDPIQCKIPVCYIDLLY